MKIVYFINGFITGGAERGLLTLLEHKCFASDDLYILALHRGPGEMADKIAKHIPKTHFICLSESPKLGLITFLKGFYWFAEHLKQIRPELVILSLSQANLIGRFIGIFFPRIPLVAFEHTTKYPKWIYYPLQYVLSWRVNAVLSDDAVTSALMKKCYFPRFGRPHLSQPLHVVTRAVTKPSYALHSPAKILMVGRLDARKNYPAALEAVTMLKERGYALSLEIIGKGKQMAELDKLRHALGLTDDVVFHGEVHGWESLAAGADIFLQASTHEGQCIAAIEAMSLSLPVVSTDVGGIQQYGKHKENMWKALSPRAEDLAEALEKLLSDLPLREKLGKMAGRDALILFGEEAFQQAWQQNYQHLKTLAEQKTWW